MNIATILSFLISGLIVYKTIIELRRKNRIKILNILFVFALIANIFILIYSNNLIYFESNQSRQLIKSSHVNNLTYRPRVGRSILNRRNENKIDNFKYIIKRDSKREKEKRLLQVSLQKNDKNYVVDQNISSLFYTIEKYEPNIKKLLNEKDIIETEKLLAVLFNQNTPPGYEHILNMEMAKMNILLRQLIIKSIRSEKVRLKQRIKDKISPKTLKNVVAEYEKRKNITFKLVFFLIFLIF
jgi:hypothetical protein